MVGPIWKALGPHGLSMQSVIKQSCVAVKLKTSETLKSNGIDSFISQHLNSNARKIFKVYLLTFFNLNNCIFGFLEFCKFGISFFVVFTKLLIFFFSPKFTLQSLNQLYEEVVHR